LVLLPTLGDGAWLQITGDDLGQLEHEAQLILQNIDLIHKETNYGEKSSIQQYGRNLVSAVSKAREVNGVVSI
jgi:hypothetical protein